MGRKVWGECARSGRRVLRTQMVYDGQNGELLVAADEYDPYHPQLRLSPRRGAGNESIVRAPAPLLKDMPPPELSGQITQVGPDLVVELEWTSGITTGLWRRYRLYRSVDGAPFEVIETFTIVRDWDASIITDIREYTDSDVISGQALQYYVIAEDWDSDVVRSNTVELSEWPEPVVLPAPVLSGDTYIASDGYNDLYWSFATPEGVTLTGFILYRRVGADPFAVIYDGTGITDLFYTDSDVSLDITYDYKVVALTSAGNSPDSNILQLLEAGEVPSENGEVEYWSSAILQRIPQTQEGIEKSPNGAYASGGVATAPDDGGSNVFKILVWSGTISSIIDVGDLIRVSIEGTDVDDLPLTEVIEIPDQELWTVGVEYFKTVTGVTLLNGYADPSYSIGAVRRISTGVSGFDVVSAYEAFHPIRSRAAGQFVYNEFVEPGYLASMPAPGKILITRYNLFVEPNLEVVGEDIDANIVVEEMLIEDTGDWTSSESVETYDTLLSVERLSSPSGTAWLAAGWRCLLDEDTTV